MKSKSSVLFFSVILGIFTNTVSLQALSLDCEPTNLSVSKELETTFMKNDKGELVKTRLSCSMTLKGEDQLIFCDYRDVYVMDLDTGEVKLIKGPVHYSNWLKKVVPPFKWCPTGVHWCEQTQTLYLANYLGKDILTFKFDPYGELVLLKRYTDPDLVSPENVDVFKDGSCFVVADYDKGAVTFFNETGKVWSRPLDNAHGVSFSPDYKFIYALGLRSSDQVCIFDLKGNLIKKKGQSRFWKRRIFMAYDYCFL